MKNTPRVPLAAAIACAVVLPLLAPACETDIQARGNLPNPDLLSQVRPGESRKEDVIALLGSPSTTSVFDNETWYYISAQTQQYAYRANEELERKVVAIKFDRGGRVTAVENLNLQDGREIAVNERETPTAGQSLGLLQQLLGNIGRFQKEEK